MESYFKDYEYDYANGMSTEDIFEDILGRTGDEYLAMDVIAESEDTVEKSV